MREQLASDSALVGADRRARARLAGGKRIRPALLLLASELCGYTGPRRVQVAAAVELLHTATLLHDDVVDLAQLRRGRASANVVWGNRRAVLVGDFLYARASQMIVEDGDLEILWIFSNTIRLMAEGELLQLERSFDPTVTEAALLRRDRPQERGAASPPRATPARSSAASPAPSGAGWPSSAASSASPSSSATTRSTTAPRPPTLGKRPCADLREGKVTLPLLLALKRCTAAEREQAAALLKTAGRRAAALSAEGVSTRRRCSPTRTSRRWSSSCAATAASRTPTGARREHVERARGGGRALPRRPGQARAPRRGGVRRRAAPTDRPPVSPRWSRGEIHACSSTRARSGRTARSAPRSSPSSPRRSSRPGSRAGAGAEAPRSAVVNVNTATVEELVRLPGIGEAKARAILDYRKERGAFKSVEQLARGEGHRRRRPRAHPPPRRDRGQDDAPVAPGRAGSGGAPRPRNLRRRGSLPSAAMRPASRRRSGSPSLRSRSPLRSWRLLGASAAAESGPAERRGARARTSHRLAEPVAHRDRSSRSARATRWSASTASRCASAARGGGAPDRRRPLQPEPRGGGRARARPRRVRADARSSATSSAPSRRSASPVAALRPGELRRGARGDRDARRARRARRRRRARASRRSAPRGARSRRAPRAAAAARGARAPARPALRRRARELRRRDAGRCRRREPGAASSPSPGRASPREWLLAAAPELILDASERRGGETPRATGRVGRRSPRCARAAWSRLAPGAVTLPGPWLDRALETLARRRPGARARRRAAVGSGGAAP